jgi:prepilin-type N-terminal cleavage/methylation domain-containing protein
MRRYRRGFSLIELMVATSVGAVLSAGAFAVLARARSSWAAAEVENRLHERAQYVLATLETELQMAGYFAGSRPASIPAAEILAAAAACGSDVVARLDRAIDVTEGRYPYSCAPQGRGQRAGADTLLVRRASARLAIPGTGRLQWLSCPNNSCTSRLLNAAAPPVAVTPPAEMRDLIVRIFYVARAADGDAATPALRVKSLSAIAGAPAFIDTEVMPGVENLQITLLPDAAAPRIVQVTVDVRADASDQRLGESLRHLAVTRQYALRNAPAAS